MQTLATGSGRRALVSCAGAFFILLTVLVVREMLAPSPDTATQSDNVDSGEATGQRLDETPDDDPPAEPMSPPAKAEVRRITRGVVYTPTGLPRDQHEFALAPVLVQEVGGQRTAEELRRGGPGQPVAFAEDPMDPDLRPSDRPEVLMWRGEARIGDANWPQLEWLVAYAPHREGEAPRLVAVRCTWDASGIAAFIEVRTRPREPRERIWVADRIEVAATEQFGAPLPGRRYAVEESTAVSPDTRVPETFREGPLPLGPFVYLGRSVPSVVTVLCRCSPARVQETPVSLSYRIREVDESVRQAWLKLLLDEEADDDWDDPGRLQSRLRIPRM